MIHTYDLEIYIIQWEKLLSTTEQGCEESEIQSHNFSFNVNLCFE